MLVLKACAEYLGGTYISMRVSGLQAYSHEHVRVTTAGLSIKRPIRCLIRREHLPTWARLVWYMQVTTANSALRKYSRVARCATCRETWKVCGVQIRAAYVALQRPDRSQQSLAQVPGPARGITPE